MHIVNKGHDAVSFGRRSVSCKVFNTHKHTNCVNAHYFECCHNNFSGETIHHDATKTEFSAVGSILDSHSWWFVVWRVSRQNEFLAHLSR